MQQIQVFDVKIKAKPMRDEKGRRGFFVAEADLKKKKNVAVILNRTKKKPKKISAEAQEVIKELQDIIDGKLKPRPVDDFLKTL